MVMFMKALRHIPFSLLLAVVLSGVLHAAALISLPGLGVSGLTELLSAKTLYANLLREAPTKHPVIDKTGKRYAPDSPSNVSNGESSGAEETYETTEAVGGGTPAAQQGSTEAGDEKKSARDDLKTEKDKEGVTEIAGLMSGATRPSQSGRAADIINFRREKFSYDIYWLGIYVGRAVLEAVKEDGIVRITSQVHSAPVISAFYKVEDYAESRVKDGRPFNFRIRQREGKYRSDKETVFDRSSGKITYYDYLKGIKAEHVVTDNVLWDVISGFYYLRTKALEPANTVFVDIFDSNKRLNAEVNVLGRGSVKLAERGEIGAIIVKPVLKSDGLFQNKGDIRIWLSEDENKMPVRVETNVSIGKVTAELRQVETEK